MTSALEKLLAEHGLNIVFENKKDSMVDALWSYIDGFESVNETEPPRDTVKKVIFETIKYLPEVTKFLSLNGQKDIADSVINYLVDKFCDYVLRKLEETGRIETED